MHNKLEQLAAIITKARHIAVLSGAGISTASGIPDFRSENGIYTKVERVEYLLSETYYYQHPKQFWISFKEIFQLDQMDSYKPNAAHELLAELEHKLGKQVTIITQNVDGLHRKAGSTHILEAHGTIASAHCPTCKRSYSLAHVLEKDVPRCTIDNFILKPDVVLFEGRVQHLEEAYEAAQNCDLFLTLGSSLEVYPVKELPYYASRAERPATAIINLSPTSQDELFNIVIHDELVATFSRLRELIK
ncbi:NAD-dependent protein deacylase [Paenibacillus septentrionalis]|uniref:protein acetyllysine N-acetyltransferase n=1 Tax=Paenibacillus septentrionalis TaxID=429342 RepID=A0ABW1V7L8_9BACL